MAKAAPERIREWRANPVQFTRDNFGVEPDAWQVKALMALVGGGVKRLAMRACVGPGKSAVEAWAGWWFTSCHGGRGEHPKGAAVAITRENLADNLWTELAKWQARSEFLLYSFEWTKTRIYAKHHPETWFLSARGFAQKATKEHLGRTLSGLHSEYVLILLDESGDMPPEIGRAAEQAMTGVKCGMIIQAGNPTSMDGLLYDSVITRRRLWDVVTITSDPEDPNRTPRVSKEWAQQQIDAMGRDNPWVMMQILGQFPPTASNTLLGLADVEKCIGAHKRKDEYSFAPRTLGVDVARFGDDRTVIFPVQGVASFTPTILRNADTSEISGRVAVEAVDQRTTQGILIDDTGGYGGGVVDSLRRAGWDPIGVNSSSKASDPRYFNLRAEMWWKMAEAIKSGMALPDVPDLAKELTAPIYFIHNGKLQLESKEQIKRRLGYSPDLADALALNWGSYIAPPNPGGMPYAMGRSDTVDSEYDPYADL